jgi:hypothetical protein
MTDKFFINAHNMPEDKPVKAEISLQLESYVIVGEAVIVTWDDSTGTIKMNDFEIPAAGISSEEEFKDIIISLLNDSGFGAKYIKGAFVKVFAKYTGITSAKVYATEFFVEKPGFKLSAKERELVYESYLYS